MSGASRYETILKLASGGMATVWIGTVRGALGFRQLVAIKKPHPHLLSDPGFRGELVAEARLASMIHHANVVDVRDVEIDGESISLVMDYIEGASLGDLLVAANRRGERVPARVAVRIILDACAGLDAAHELVDERGRPVGLVHRDVSPQNILVGSDGISRVADFGVAKFARKNMQSTSEGSLKGKLAYMAPEYVRAEGIDRRFDVFALGVVLWEALSGKRCFRGENEAETLHRLLEHVPDPVSAIAPELAPLDAVVACALAKNRDERFQNAQAMGAALEASALAAGLLGGHGEVARAVKDLVGPAIEERRALVRAKQANEPSVASLMGVPPIVVPQAAAATIIDAPMTAPATPPTVTSPAAATPKMGGAAGAMTVPAVSAVPSTQPMTPRMEPAPAPTFVPRTLASPAAMPVAMPTAAPAIPNTTLRSTDGHEADVPNLAFHEASARAVAPMDIPGVSRGSPPRWLVPVLVGAAAVAIVGGAAVFVTKKPAPAGSEPALAASLPATASAAAPAASASPASVATSTTTATATAEATTTPPPPTASIRTVRTAPTTRPTMTAAPAPLPAPAPTPTPTPTPTAEATATATGRRPPPNPYGAQ